MEQKLKLKQQCNQHLRKLGINSDASLRKQIKKIFEEHDNQADAVVEIYKLALPTWDDIKSIDGYPEAGEELCRMICREFIEFDHKYHPGSFAGGLWLNKGFSVNRNLSPWEIGFDDCSVNY